jgi:hypothetical protein
MQNTLLFAHPGVPFFPLFFSTAGYSDSVQLIDIRFSFVLNLQEKGGRYVRSNC